MKTLTIGKNTYEIVDKTARTEIDKFGGTVEITSETPKKENTVMTINPDSEDINIYSADEVDEKTNDLSNQIDVERERTDDLTRQITVERGRIDKFVALPEGSTYNEAELEDVRVAYDGKTYDTAGNAVRGQIGQLSEEITDVKGDLANIVSYKYKCFDVSNIANNVFDGSANVTNATITITKANSYKTYCFIVDKEYHLYFDDSTISSLSYLSICMANAPIGEWIGDDAYKYIDCKNPIRFRKLENNLPTKSNVLDIKKDSIICITIPVNASCNVWIDKQKVLNEDIEVKAQTKKCFIKHENGSFDRANERVLVYTPTHIGYIVYHLYHYESLEVNADTWGIYNAYHVDDLLENEIPLTTNGEWECAIRLSQRPDFSGGIMHGDEIYSLFKLFLDDKEVSLNDIDSIIEFDNLKIVEKSMLLDPLDSVSEIAEHGKEYNFSKNGLVLNQSLKWKISAKINSSYMAMFTPLKTITDSYFTDVDFEPKTIPSNPNEEIENVRKARIYSKESGFFADFEIAEYPSGLEYGDVFLLTDNNGGRYNKMYYKLCNGHESTIGELWKTTTVYRLGMNKSN